jgi:hypothetical protein
MPVDKEHAVLLLLKTKNVIALYSKKTGEHKIIDAFGLFKPGTGGTDSKHCSVTIWVDGNQVKMAHTTATPPIKVDWILKPDLWLDGETIVIGVGDMRDVKTAEIGKLDLSTVLQGEFVLEHVDDYRITVRCTKPIPFTASNTPITLCS